MRMNLYELICVHSYKPIGGLTAEMLVLTHSTNHLYHSYGVRTSDFIHDCMLWRNKSVEILLTAAQLY